MSKPSILVVEDEPLIADDIAEILEKNGFEVYLADEAKDALDIIDKCNPDLAILDINIDGEQDGIALAGQITIPFVFLTSYYDKATLARAAKVNPSGYLVKPFDENELVANVEIALSKKITKPHLSPRFPEKLFVRKEQEIIALMSDQIVYAEAFDNYTKLFTSDDKYIISHTLKRVEETLGPHGFMRIHRSFIINFNAIDSIAENYVYLKGRKVQIGKAYKKLLMDRLTMI